MNGIRGAAFLLLWLFLSGCSVFHNSSTGSEVVAPDDATGARDSSAVGGNGREIRIVEGDRFRIVGPYGDPVVSPPADTTGLTQTAIDSLVATPPADPPVLTVRMSAEEEARLRRVIITDMDRAKKAVDLVRNRPLMTQQVEQLAAAEKFLQDATTARNENDLRRAKTLAEKARIIAEQLRQDTD